MLCLTSRDEQIMFTLFILFSHAVLHCWRYCCISSLFLFFAVDLNSFEINSVWIYTVMDCTTDLLSDIVLELVMVTGWFLELYINICIMSKGYYWCKVQDIRQSCEIWQGCCTFYMKCYNFSIRTKTILD